MLKRIHLLAAEIFSYSYDNYDDHVGVNERFDRIMPDMAGALEKAVNQNWPKKKVAQAIDVPEKDVDMWLGKTRDALRIVDAADPAELFRNGVRQSLKNALENGFQSDEDREKLVTQICYRVADLSLLLKQEGDQLFQYSRHLRKEPGVEYEDGYFEEGFAEGLDEDEGYDDEFELDDDDDEDYDYGEDDDEDDER